MAVSKTAKTKPQRTNIGSLSAANVGFMLSFVDNASQQLDDVTDAYTRMTKALDLAIKRASNTSRFNKGMDNIVNHLRKVAKEAFTASSAMSAVMGASPDTMVAGRRPKLVVDVKIPKVTKFAEGGIVNGPTHGIVGEKGPEAIIPLDKLPKILKDAFSSMGSFSMSMKDKAFILGERFFGSAGKFFGKLKPVAEQWGGMFGKKGVETAKKVSGYLGKFFKNMAALDIGEQVKKMSKSMESITRAGGIADRMKGVGEATEGARTAMWETQKILSLSRPEFKKTRKEVRSLGDSFKDSYGNFVTRNIDNVARAMHGLANAHERDTKFMIPMSRIIDRTTEATGVETQQLATWSAQLHQIYGRTPEQINALFMTTKKVSEKTNTDFTAAMNDMMSQASSFGDILSKLPDEQKQHALASLAITQGVAGQYEEAGKSMMGIMEGILRMPLSQLKQAAGLGVDAGTIKGLIQTGKSQEAMLLLTKQMAKIPTTGMGGEKFREVFDMDAEAAVKAAQATKGMNENFEKLRGIEVKVADAASVLNEEFKTNTKWADRLKTGMGNLAHAVNIGGYSAADLRDDLKDIGWFEMYFGIKIAKEALVPFAKEAWKFGKAIVTKVIPAVWGWVAGLFAKTTATTTDTLAMGGQTMAMGGQTLAMGVGTKATLLNTVSKWASVAVHNALTAATWLLTAAQKALTVAFLSTPIGWIVLGVAALVAGFILLWKYCKPFRDFFLNLGDALSKLGSIIWSFVQPALKFLADHWLLLLGPIGWAIEAFKYIQKLLSSIPSGGGFFGWIKEGIERALKVVQPLADLMSGVWNRLTRPRPEDATKPKVTPEAEAAIITSMKSTKGGKDKDKAGKTTKEMEPLPVDFTEVTGWLKIIANILEDMGKGKKTGLAVAGGSGNVSVNQLAARGTI